MFQNYGVPPPIPARQNKAPAIPKRKNLPKLPLNAFPETNSSPQSTHENGVDPPKPNPPASNQIQVKLPPPPQPAHSKRSQAAFARNKETKTTELTECENNSKLEEPSHTDLQKQPASNGTYSEIKALTPLQNAALFNSLQNKSTEEGYFKFPKVGHMETFPSSSTEDVNCDTYSHTRRKSGKKIPPPIQTYTNRTIDDISNFNDISKVPTSHDSTLSCSDGGISQTSSPSYLVRSLESPLLPMVKSHSTNRHSKRKFITCKLFSEMNEFEIQKDDEIHSPPDLTISQSTPGGLQTVVDYEQGANLPYQHKVGFK